jgi:hypothetical protein
LKKIEAPPALFRECRVDSPQVAGQRKGYGGYSRRRLGELERLVAEILDVIGIARDELRARAALMAQVSGAVRANAGRGLEF